MHIYLLKNNNNNNNNNDNNNNNNNNNKTNTFLDLSNGEDEGSAVHDQVVRVRRLPVA